MKPSLAALALVCLLQAAACGRTDVDGPPSLRLGRDECAECGMAIHEERSSSALLVERGGRREHLLFDDIACMLDAERAEDAEFKVIGRFVHDHAAGAWLPEDAAVYLSTDGSTLRTPMGSGMVAFADRAGAEDARRRFGGEILDYSALADRRRAQMEERQKASGG